MQFISERRPFRRVHQALMKDIPERFDRISYSSRALHNRHHFDRIQRIIQKMWVDLRP